MGESNTKPTNATRHKCCGEISICFHAISRVDHTVNITHPICNN